MTKFMTAARRFLSDESGATMVEYALMVALIAIVAIAAVTLIGTNVTSQFNAIANGVG